MFVKPGTGPSPDDPEKRITFAVRDPITRALMPETGGDVLETSFWLCRLRDGDVVKAEPPPPPEPPPPEVEQRGADALAASAEEH